MSRIWKLLARVAYLTLYRLLCASYLIGGVLLLTVGVGGVPPAAALTGSNAAPDNLLTNGDFSAGTTGWTRLSGLLLKFGGGHALFKPPRERTQAV